MYYNYLNKRNILLNKKAAGEDTDSEIERVEEELRVLYEPVKYGGKDGILLKIDKNFETNCVVLRQNGFIDPEKISVFKFYQAIDLIKKQNENGKPKRNTRHK